MSAALIEASPYARFPYRVHLHWLAGANVIPVREWCEAQFGREASQAKFRAVRFPYNWQRWGCWRSYGNMFYFHRSSDAVLFQFMYGHSLSGA
jgi:hypothetical protein